MKMIGMMIGLERKGEKVKKREGLKEMEEREVEEEEEGKERRWRAELIIEMDEDKITDRIQTHTVCKNKIVTMIKCA